MKPDEEQSAGRIEQALRESEDRFRDFLEIAAAWFWETDEGLRIVRLDGRAPLHPIDQVIGRPAWDILGGDPTAAPWRDHIATMQAREPFRNFEVQVVAPDGTPLWVASSGRPVFAADGTFRGYRGIAVDITAHKRAESEARGEAALFEATLEHMDQGLLMIDATETVRVYNHRILELLDLPEDLLAQRPNFLAVREYQLSRGEFARSNDAFRQWVENRGVNEIRDSYERVRPDGRVLEIRTVPLPDGGAVRTYTDITARRQAEAELKASEERYRALVTASSSMIWRADADGFILEGFGRDTHPGEFRAAYQGHGWIDEVHPEDRIEALAVWNGILASAEPGENRFRLRRTDGQYRWFVSRMAPLKNPDGSVREWIGSLTDIHEHRAAQTVLWETNERLASALRAGRMMAWDWNLVTGRVTRSDTSLDVLGLPSGDIGAFLDRIPEEDRTAYLAAFEAATRGGGAYDVEYRFHKPDGQTAWMRETGQVDFAPDGKAVRARGLVFDISQRKQAEESLQESERRLSTLLDNLPGFAYRCRNEPHWPMDYVSEGIRAIAGYAPADLQEPAALSWADIMHPDDRELVWSQVQDAVRLNRPFEFTYRVRTRGGEERWVRERGQGVRRANGELEALEGFISDITEQRRTEERLRQSQKMEAVGQLTGGIAHDFNNLLTVILGNAEILVDDPGNPALTRTLAQMVVEAAEKGAELTQHLLAFGRRQSLKPVRVSLDHVVRGMTPLLQRTLGEHIELRTDLANSLHAALTDRTLLESAILNLAVNAKDAMPQGGTLTITCGEAVAGPDQGALPIGQDVVFVTVSDTGRGMSPDVLSRVFEPFFTTKEVGKGSGLGLSMVYGFAQQSGGHVAIESRPGQGTAVTILLPAVTSVAAVVPVREPDRPTIPGRERVLLVEDEPQVLQFVSAQLVGLGYDVTAVSAGPDALDLLREDSRFDLLFTDVVLPRGMSGVELASQARQIRPGIKVLLTSGYPEEVFEHHGSPERGTLLLRKPYKRKDLAETLRKVLDPQGA